MPAVGDLVSPGERYRNWTVIRETAPSNNGSRRWWCRCRCGREKAVAQGDLRKGTTVGCSHCFTVSIPKAWTPEARRKRERSARKRARRGPKEDRVAMWRCRLPDPESTERHPFACGAVVFADERERHAAEVHHIKTVFASAFVPAMEEAA